MDPHSSGGETLAGPFTLGPEHTIRAETPDLEAPPGPRRGLAEGYVLAEVIGTGGTAVVRRAHQASLDREVAIKTPHTAHTPGAVARVLQEAWVTGALEHPGVVPVHDLVVDEAGCPHIVMRRMEGWTWTELLNHPEAVTTRFGARDVLEWHLRVLMTVAATVHHAHGRGVLHRDLKPDNVMVGPSGEVCVLDWGIAVAIDDRAAHRLPRAAEQVRLAGTPHYMAPEMARADGAALGVPTDVYLLGSLLYAVLARRPPHVGPDVQAVVDAAATELPPVPAGPARLVAICMRTLALEPSERPATAEVFRRELQSWLEERDADALCEAGVSTLAELRAAPEAAPEAVPTLHAGCRLAFEQALLRQPSHDVARAGLDEAHTLRVRWDLGRKDIAAAAAHLALVSAPPPALVADVERARVRAERDAAEATRLLADHDPGAGIRTRAFLSLVLGLLITLAPMGAHLFHRDATMVEVAVGTTLVMAAMAGMWVWARDSLSKSLLNRSMIRGLIATPAVHLAMIGGASLLGLDAATVVVFFPLNAAIITALFAIILDAWLAIPGAVYLLAFFGAASFPALRWVILSGANAALLATVLLRWGPEALQSWIKMRRERGARV